MFKILWITFLKFAVIPNFLFVTLFVWHIKGHWYVPNILLDSFFFRFHLFYPLDIFFIFFRHSFFSHSPADLIKYSYLISWSFGLFVSVYYLLIIFNDLLNIFNDGYLSRYLLPLLLLLALTQIISTVLQPYFTKRLLVL